MALRKGGRRLPPHANYFRPASDLHPDGNRLVVAQVVTATPAPAGEDAQPERFLIVTNFFEELRQRMGN